MRIRTAIKLLNAYRRSVTGGIDRRNTPTLVFPEWKIAYIPVPKAACSSIMNALMPLVGAEPLQSVSVHQFDGFQRIPLADCKVDDDWFVFTAVRHPIDRAISAWKDKVGNPNQPNVLRENGIQPGDSFDYFVRTISLWPAKALNPHVMPQSMVLHYAKDLPLKVFRSEDLTAQWGDISREIEMRSDRPIAPLNRINATGVITQEISLTLELKLRRLYAEDFKAWYPEA